MARTYGTIDGAPRDASEGLNQKALNALEARRDTAVYSHCKNSHIHSLTFGCGEDIFRTILPSLSSVTHEIIFITCFWAGSPSLDLLSDSLRTLSTRVLERRGQKVRVRIGFSSLSLFQKLFHTWSPDGQNYPPSSWVKKFGLPPPEELQGLDLEIKSIFILPFSVMHPKFIILDRKKVFLPSCNVSWETWFEGCVELSGGIVDEFVQFWEQIWARTVPKHHLLNIATGTLPAVSSAFPLTENGTVLSSAASSPLAYSFRTFDPPYKIENTLFLPSFHHVNPQFRPFCSQDDVQAPNTPLNRTLLALFDGAQYSIYIQTPNLTSPPVLSALLHALKRGVDVHILTSERLMILEQLVTAGTTTARCVQKLISRYKRLSSAASNVQPDEEAMLPKLGELRVEYYKPNATLAPHERKEPVQSHLKLTIVDEAVLVLGSGNMDRASWFTSQELGVAFFSEEAVEQVKKAMGGLLARRKKEVFISSDG